MRTLMIAVMLGSAALAAPMATAATVVASTAIPSGSYVIDPAHASITFRVVHFGLSHYPARLTKFTSTIDLDAADLSKSKVSVDIDAMSVKTEFPFPDKTDFDAEIGGGANFLNGKAFPKITFVSTGIVATSATTGKITGNLTLRGVTKPITLDAKLNGVMPMHPMAKVPVLGVSATGMIKRSDFGMDFGKQFVSDDVELIIEAEYRKAS